MKVINRRMLEQYLDMTRRYFGMQLGKEAEELLMERSDLARDIEKAGGPYPFCLDSFVCSFFGRNGIDPEITNEQLIGLLLLLGWTVAETEA